MGYGGRAIGAAVPGVRRQNEKRNKTQHYQGKKVTKAKGAGWQNLKLPQKRTHGGGGSFPVLRL
jgi:hypothetical protein